MLRWIIQLYNDLDPDSVYLHSPQCPTACSRSTSSQRTLVTVLAPLVVLVVQMLSTKISLLSKVRSIVRARRVRVSKKKRPWNSGLHPRTLGRVTSGTITTLTALGASLGAADLSPPGWYRYLPSVEPVSHGMPAEAIGTVFSDVDLVGVRPEWIVSTGSGTVCSDLCRGARTEVESSSRNRGHHNTTEDLYSQRVSASSPIAVQCRTETACRHAAAGRNMTHHQFRIALRLGLQGLSARVACQSAGRGAESTARNGTTNNLGRHCLCGFRLMVEEWRVVDKQEALVEECCSLTVVRSRKLGSAGQCKQRLIGQSEV
jgi:hypothetical protein